MGTGARIGIGLNAPAAIARARPLAVTIGTRSLAFRRTQTSRSSSACIFESGSTFPSSPVLFAGQLIELFTQQFGAWSYPIIALAAFGTMFTTLLTCFDAYPRVISSGVQILRNETEVKTRNSISTSVLLVSGVGVIIILYFWLDNLKTLIDFATTVGFLAANLIAIFNFLIALQLRKKGLYPAGWFRWFLMIAGLISLMGFSVVYLII